ncbi:crossover junction endodeoxyribonuclease RuvC [Oscillospiraceae bacterium MB08-C2-2]|nr:crossover junction endodeoxyribonuclease RuvC [Oscillospiraceae bacterium MB08-C2-2]
MIIMGIDPGYAIVGYGVVDYTAGHRFRPVAYGAIITEADTPFEQRLEHIWDRLVFLLSKYKPKEIAVEKLYFTTNQKTAIQVAQARGVILLAAVKAGVEVYEYTPLQVKQSVVGYGKAEKNQVMQMTKSLLGLEQIPKPDDAADALAIAICHSHTSGSRVNMKNLLYRG